MLAHYCKYMFVTEILCKGYITYRPKHGPLFYLEILLDDEGVHYTTDLEQFQEVLVNIFDHGINVTHSVPQIEKVSILYYKIHKIL